VKLSNVAILCLSYVLLLPVAVQATEETIALGRLLPESSSQGYGMLTSDKSVSGTPLSVGGQRFEHGLGTHAHSEIVYELADMSVKAFTALVGADDALKDHPEAKTASMVFQVFVDDGKKFDSGVMHIGDKARPVNVDLTGAKTLKLVVTDAGDGISCDHADWAEAVLVGKVSEVGRQRLEAKYEVKAPGLTLRLNEAGNVVRCLVGEKKQGRAVFGETKVAGCRLEGKVEVKKLWGGGFTFSRRMTDSQEHSCTLTESFKPTNNSIRWEVEIRGDGKPWTSAISTVLRWPEPSSANLWMAWQDPLNDCLNIKDKSYKVWNDPLIAQPFISRTWFYGQGRPDAAGHASFEHGSLITLPLVSILAKQHDFGLSLVQSPEDALLDMDLEVHADGTLVMNRFNHRLGEGRSVRFSLDLVAHEADWRGGLRWLVARYPAYFNPPNPLVDQMAGCGAYSGDEKPVDAARLKRMGFRINWKVSNDYACMGIFLPPLTDPDARWDRLPDALDQAGYKPMWTSFRRLNDYAAWLRSQGFYLLSYFNTTEFGANMHDVSVPTGEAAADPDLWKKPSEYLKLRMPNAPMSPRGGAWQGGWTVDPGDPAYQAYLLEQAERHIRVIPEAAGICIDRADYLRNPNFGADDGLSWVNGKPARSLVVSWRSLLDKLGPLMLKNDKVIFCNLMHPRLDLARHLDGIYDEFGGTPCILNGESLLCVRKPAIAWTGDDNAMTDEFFQRHLYLGVFPTVPYPSNNHCITPSPERDQWYCDYGPLLDAMRGRKWVLTQHCVEVVNGEAKANLFEVQGGYAMPVTFGGTNQLVKITVRNVKGLKKATYEAIYPGTEKPVALTAVGKDGVFELSVPLKRGCAMVKLITKH